MSVFGKIRMTKQTVFLMKVVRYVLQVEAKITRDKISRYFCRENSFTVTLKTVNLIDFSMHLPDSKHQFVPFAVQRLFFSYAKDGFHRLRGLLKPIW